MRFMLRIRGVFGAAIITAVTASVLAACSGGGSSLPQAAQVPQLPAAGTPNTTDSNQVVTINVNQSAVPSFSGFKVHVTPVSAPGTLRKPMGTVFPVDMSFHGGHVLSTAQMHEVFINTTAAAVGVPATFQANFSNSTFVHVLDQYAGTTANNRYPVNATSFIATISAFSNVISDNQLFTVLHSVVATTHLSGYGHMYNLFLKPGLDTCMDFGGCYSPDNPSSFVFCAYHGSITFSDVGHVIFSVMPYQHTPGCGDSGLTVPNPVPIDDTAATLSHEESEAISDPDPGGGYFNDNFGYEIGDLCAPYRVTESLNAHSYLIQPEYSNSVHACFF